MAFIVIGIKKETIMELLGILYILDLISFVGEMVL